MSEYVTLESRIEELIVHHGGLRAAARVLNINPGYLSRLKNNRKCSPSASLLRRMGLVRETCYRREDC